jgi:pterin-4a-carbinolamine dehydratase
MSRLLEIALGNSLERNVESGLNLSSSNILSKSLANIQKSTLSELPVEPKKATWEEIQDYDKTYLTKTYKFYATKHMIYFINEGMKKFDDMNHHAKLEIENDIITVSTYTHDVNDITNQDIILKSYLDELFNDIVYISRM